MTLKQTDWGQVSACGIHIGNNPRGVSSECEGVMTTRQSVFGATLRACTLGWSGIGAHLWPEVVKEEAI